MHSVTMDVWPLLFLLTVVSSGQDSVTAQSVVTQTRTLTGRVVDKGTGQPVPEAIVSITGVNVSSRGNSEGKFTVALPAAAPCTLIVTKAGYDTASLPLPPDRENEPVEIALVPSSLLELKKMRVKARRNNVKSFESLSKISMAPELVANLPGAGQADVFRALQLLPGVSGTNEASSGLFVRGGTPDQNLIFLDRMPIYYVDHFYGFFSAFNPQAIDEVTLYKGGFGPQWGGRLSGVVEMSSSGRNMKNDSGGVRAAVGAGLLCSDVFVRLPVINDDIGTVMIAGRRSMTDLYRTDLFDRIFTRMHEPDTLNNPRLNQTRPPMPGETDRIVYQPKLGFWDFNGLAAFRLGPRGRLATTIFASRDNQDNSLDTTWTISSVVPIVRSSRENPGVRDTARIDTTITTTVINDKAPVYWGNLCIGQEWEQRWSDAVTSNLSLSYSDFTDKKSEEYFRAETISERHSDTTSPKDTTMEAVSWMASTNQITDISGRLDNSFRVSDWNTIRAGVEISRKSVSYERDTILPDTTGMEWLTTPSFMRRYPTPVSSHDTGVSLAAYVRDELTLGDKAGLTLGGRLYYFKLLSAFSFDPRVSGWWKPFPGMNVKGAWGMYTQEIHRAVQEDIMGGSKFVWLLATNERPLETSQQFIGGISWEKSRFLFDVEAYYKRFRGLLTISERVNSYGTGNEPFDPERLSLFEGTGSAKGIEVLLQAREVTIPFAPKKLIFDGWAAYTWSKVENTYAVFNSGTPFPAMQDRPHEIKLVNNLAWDIAPWTSLRLGAVWLYATGAPYTAPLGTYKLVMIDSSTTHYFQHVSDKNEYRLPDYHRLDLSLTWRVRLGNHMEGNLTLGLFNAYNNENIIERTYTSSYIGSYGPSTVAYTPMDKRSMLITPNAALQLSAMF